MSIGFESSALGRFKVLDLSRVRAGPVCVRQLADFGADVLKIENPVYENLAGPRDGSDFQNLHRNKRSLTLNLKSPEGVKIFYELVKTADVVVENYRPDVKFRLGIDYETLKAINPRIILVSISGFGEDGPYASRPGLDQIAQGLSGLMSVTGKAGEGPMRVGAAIADVTAGLLGGLGVLTALLEREVSGQGQWVQSNLLSAGLTLLDFQAARYTIANDVPKQMGNDHPSYMPTSAYPTKDGFINIAVTGSSGWENFCRVTGRDDLWQDMQYKTPKGRSDNRQSLNQALSKMTLEKTTADWMEILLGGHIACGPIYQMDEVFADPQVKHLQSTVAVTHPELGELNLLNQGVKLTRTPAKIVASSPLQGQHTNQVLEEMGYTEEQIKDLRTKAVI